MPLPDGVASLFGLNMDFTMPVFLVILGTFLLGLLFGFIWEWLREHKHRAEAARRTREVESLERELRREKRLKNEGKDEVLALLETTIRNAPGTQEAVAALSRLIADSRRKVSISNHTLVRLGMLYNTSGSGSSRAMFST